VTARRSTRRLFAASVAVGCAGLLVACTAAPTPSPLPTSSASATSADPTSAAPSSSTASDLSRFYDQKLSWSGCGGTFECARLTVPIDYADPTGDTIRLALVRLPAADGGARLGSLVLNPGGPGGSGVDYARAARAIIDQSVRDKYDIVGFDPRGVARSGEITCLTDAQTDTFLASDATPDDAAEVAQLQKLSREFAASCQKNSAALLGHIDTVTTAKDMDVLRATLGDQKLNWMGASYGTFLGATYADLFPARVGRMVLDGALDPTLSNEELAHGQAKGFEVALQRFVEDCAKKADCPLPRDTTSAIDRIQEFLAGLDSTPLDTGDPKRPLTQALAANAILTYLYFPPSDWEQLRFGLQLAFEGDGSALLQMLDARLERGENGTYHYNPLSSFLSISALDRPDRQDAATSARLADEWSKEAPVFGSYLAWGNLVFDSWPIPATGEPHALHATGSAPILVVGTTYDPATPYPWAQALASQLDNAVLLTRVGDGHTAYGMGSSCVNKAVDSYLTTGEPPAAGTVCR